MNNTHIRLIILITAIALLGLIFLQYSWIKDAIAVKEAQFHQKIHQVLAAVAEKVKKFEAAELLQERYANAGRQPKLQLVITDSSAYYYSSHSIQSRYPKKQQQPAPTLHPLEGTGKIRNKNNLEKTLPISKSFLGVYLKDAPKEQQGALIMQILNDSPAEEAGLQKEDIITAIDNYNITKPSDVVLALKNYRPGDDININYKRKQYVVSKEHNTTFWKSENLNNITSATLEEHFDYFATLAVEMTFSQKPLEDRINPEILEQTIESCLSDAGINIPYQYCLQSGQECTVYSSGNASEGLLYSPFRKQIYHDAIYTAPAELLLHFPNEQQYIWKSASLMLGSSLFFNLVIIGIFAYILHTIIQQKKLSDMKTDFINNMTHELKTPISTIKLACEMLTDNNLPKTEQRIQRYANIINDENHRLQNHVEKVLQFARIEKGNLKLNIETLDMHKVLNEAISKISLQVSKNNGKIDANLQATQYLIDGDKLHLTNVIYNLLDNAIKYAKGMPDIHISTQNYDNKHLSIAIRDSGIGIDKDTLKRIFDKFYRVPTGNIHNVKGFGLGLSYVKLMTELHHGEVSAISKINKGSTFTIVLPIKQ